MHINTNSKQYLSRNTVLQSLKLNWKVNGVIFLQALIAFFKICLITFNLFVSLTCRILGSLFQFYFLCCSCPLCFVSVQYLPVSVFQSIYLRNGEQSSSVNSRFLMILKSCHAPFSMMSFVLNQLLFLTLDLFILYMSLSCEQKEERNLNCT